MRTTYEWVVEQMDGEDIVDTSGWDELDTAIIWADRADLGSPVISLRRDVGDDIEGIVDRQEAYYGDEAFTNGAAIPAHLKAQLASIPERFRE